jgi:hypothetical protein
MKKMSKEELKATQQEMLLNILSAKRIIYTHYKNKQLKQRKQNDTKSIRNMGTKS